MPHRVNINIALLWCGALAVELIWCTLFFYIEKNVDLKQCDKKSGPLIASLRS
jgi:hypothetical protein